MIRVFHRAANPQVRRSRMPDVFKSLEPDPVEPDQPGLRSQPQIAVMGLDNRVNGSLRQALLALPDAMDILSQCPGRIQTEGRRQCGENQNAIPQIHALLDYALIVRPRVYS